MLHRHDFVTPYIDGIRFFDKPPLMYWLAAASMRVFGEHDWAARFPIALTILALLLAIYALALHLFRGAGNPERAAFYSALIFATSIGPYLYTRFFIPDLLICLWLTLGTHAFLLALARVTTEPGAPSFPVSPERVGYRAYGSTVPPGTPHTNSALLPCLAFAALLALNLLTKGFIGLVFPLAFVLLFLALTRQLHLLPRFHLLTSTAVFLAIALPWHVLAALRNPPIPFPPGLGLPAQAGWAWFYLYNEQIARAFGHRIPQDYGNTPIPLFYLYTLIWIMPWAAFLPAALRQFNALHKRHLPSALWSLNPEASLTLTLWPLTVLLFFTLSHRQEYYSLPALPALALLLGTLLARADSRSHPLRAPFIASLSHAMSGSTADRVTHACHRWLLLPLTSLVATACAFFAITAPHPTAGTDLAALLASNPAFYNVSLGHIFDLTGEAMGLFRGPLALVALGMVILGPAAYILRRRTQTYAANLTLAAGMILVLLAAHEGLVRFNPILGSKSLALAIVKAQRQTPQPNDVILIDGELTSGSTLLFYTRQPVHLVNGRINGPWFGSFYPDAPPIFETEASLRRLWSGPTRVFLLTYTSASRTHDLEPFAPVHTLVAAGGKTILTNR